MVESMNTGDYCAEGRELYTRWQALNSYHWGEWGEPRHMNIDRATREAYRLWKEHKDECAVCSGKDGE